MSAPTVPQTISAEQANKEVPIQEDIRASCHQTVYAYRDATSSGLTFGYHGGRWGSFSVAAGTLTLTGSTTNYIVVLRSSGVPSVSASATNWNDSTNYARVYRVTTDGSGITNLYGADFDYRAGPGGVHGSNVSGGGAVDSVNGQTGTVVLDSFDIEHTDAESLFGSPSTVGNAIRDIALASWEWSGFLDEPEDATYTLVLKAPFAGRILETTTKSTSGSGTVAWEVNGSPISGGSNTVSSSEQDIARNTTFAAGDTITFDIVNDSPSIVGMAFTVRYRRTSW